MKKIDAHSHLGDFGGWAGISFGEAELLRQTFRSRHLSIAFP